MRRSIAKLSVIDADIVGHGTALSVVIQVEGIFKSNPTDSLSFNAIISSNCTPTDINKAALKSMETVFPVVEPVMVPDPVGGDIILD